MPTIVVAEDDDAIRRMMLVLLRYYGFRVLEARDGHEAALLCESDLVIDLLITDLGMPRMNGHELIARLASHNDAPRVLVVSGVESAFDVPHLKKPFTPQQLRAAVAEALEAPPLQIELYTPSYARR
ncbi:MAG TPA: response regulator [Myxococcota bacterium]